MKGRYRITFTSASTGRRSAQLAAELDRLCGDSWQDFAASSGHQDFYRPLPTWTASYFSNKQSRSEQLVASDFSVDKPGCMVGSLSWQSFEAGQQVSPALQLWGHPRFIACMAQCPASSSVCCSAGESSLVVSSTTSTTRNSSVTPAKTR